MAHKPKAPPTVADINVTPLVDVMLVLLIIFMVITPMLQHGFSVDLAKAANPRPMPDAEKEDAVELAITRDGKVYLGTSQVKLDEITTKVKDRISSKLDKTVYVKSDARAKYGDVVNVVDHLHHIAVLRPRVTFNVDRLVQLTGDPVLHLGRDLVELNLTRTQINLTVSGDGQLHGVLFLCIGHRAWVGGLRQVNAEPVLQHGSDDHEDDQQNEHHVDQRSDVDVRHGGRRFGFVSHYFFPRPLRLMK